MGTFDPYDPNSADTPGAENPACPSDCDGDVDGDNTVGVNDLLAVIAAWGTSDAAADVDGDGNVGVNDLLALIAAWGPC